MRIHSAERPGLGGTVLAMAWNGMLERGTANVVAWYELSMPQHPSSDGSPHSPRRTRGSWAAQLTV